MINLDGILLGRNINSLVNIDIRYYEEDEDNGALLEEIQVSLQDRNGGWQELGDYYEEVLLDLGHYLVGKDLYSGGMPKTIILKDKELEEFLEFLKNNKVILEDSEIQYFKAELESFRTRIKRIRKPKRDIDYVIDDNKKYEAFDIRYGDEIEGPYFYILLNHTDENVLVIVNDD